MCAQVGTQIKVAQPGEPSTRRESRVRTQWEESQVLGGAGPSSEASVGLMLKKALSRAERGGEAAQEVLRKIQGA